MAKAQVVMIGAGHLGSLILNAWIKKKIVLPKNLSLHLNSEKSHALWKKKLPKATISSHESKAMIPKGDVYVIAVKPQQWTSIKDELKKIVKKDSLVVSIMAGIPPSKLEADLGCPCIVAMTNTSLQVGNALTTIYKSSKCKEENLKWAQKAFGPFGMIATLEEKDFAAATALGGSHPAFAIWILNEISKIISNKLPGQDSMAWTLNIFKGAEKLIRKKKDVKNILTQIATPGGCTAEGLKALEDLKIAPQLKEVFDKCQLKAEGLGK
ncbi:MAG: pyrroline-5-carboxylate reductase dimerization domain-containing protein [Bdellovibrionota bacterium]